MTPTGRTFWKAVGIAIKKRRREQSLTLSQVEKKSGLWLRLITAVENGEHQPTYETLKCLDRVLQFKEPLRSVLFSSVRPILWLPSDIVAGVEPMSLIFRGVYYSNLITLGRQATVLRYCTPILVTALSPSSFLRSAIEAKFGTTRQARALAAQMMYRSAMDCERVRRGQARSEIMFLLDETREHLRSLDSTDRIDFLTRLFDAGDVELRVVASRPTESELQALSFAMMVQRDGRGCVCITDQPLLSQTGRDCWIDGDQSVRFKASEELYRSFWNDRHTRKIDPRDLLGL